ncbi:MULTISPECIES: cell cycle histidine kinase CckA [unclassified Aureimonas]|uniref:cell cycle histidine kinase CckA n=1 Tax=unclassified Aureimonas TaxID=2615206 RepID=UPI0006F6C74F|nr:MULTISPECIES: PAS domain-containing sensor histidine kinase [unclassified Aureimonas]KQT57418.1 histidine kinase [Aureimonas sp. Leaf427]KQT77097.1 histidine kinase [Aureimonas sp. Leaf460]
MTNGTGVGLPDKPLIDRTAGARNVRKLLVLCGALFFLAAIPALLGHSYGGKLLLAIFALLAVVGVVVVFAAAVGLVSFSAQPGQGGIANDFLDTLDVGTLIVDRRGRIVYANKAYGLATGAANDPAELRTIERLLARERDASEAIYRLANLARDQRSGQEEIRLPRSLADASSTEPRWYRVSVRPLSGASGALQAWQIADVTAERDDQETFFQDLQHAIDYLDHAPAGFFAADAKGRIAYINATLADWLGVDLVAFRPYARAIAEFAADGDAALLSTSPEAAEAGAVSIVDLDLVRADGHRLPVRLLRKTGLLPDGAPGLSRTIVLQRNIDAKGAGALDAAEVRFTRFFNSSPMAIAALGHDGRVVRANAAFARMFGQPAAGGLVSVGEVVGDESRDALRNALLAAGRHDASIPVVDVELPGSSPTRVARLYLSAAGESGDGSGDAAILYGVDITDQRSLEEQFAKSQKMQAVGNLAGGIAHDFNNVLTIITASVDFLLLNHRSGDPSFQDLLLIKQSANRAASLVRQLLAYSRRQTMRPKMLNLTDVIADMHLLLKRISGDLVKLERHHARDLWPVMADIGQFEQVITNLVQNARDAMPEGGRIQVSTRNVPDGETRGFGYAEMQGGDHVLVEVMDSGTGMPADVAERIFEPFFTTKEIGKGTGLGLSMVYGIVKQSGGFIFVDSKVGQGTTFRIFLPRHIPADLPLTNKVEPSLSAEQVAAKADLSGTASILLVEDEDHVRAGNVRALKMRGYEVHEASSGVEALEVMEAIGGRVDLVVSDVVMPEMDGPTLLREMRAKRPDLKFIFVSGYAEDAFAKNLPEGEKFGFLAKPFSLRDLAIAVKDMLEE